MTTVRLYKASGSGTHIVIYSVQVTETATKNATAEYTLPITQSDWSSCVPVRYVMDLKDVKRAFKIEGFIDKTSNKKATATEWDDDDDTDVGATWTKLYGLLADGGVIKLDYPIASEGYTSARTFNVLINSIKKIDGGKFQDIVNDQVSPGTTTERAEFYEVVIECFEAENQ